MKLKSRTHSGWTHRTASSRYRKLNMPKFASSRPGEFAADQVHARCGVFKFAKRINRMPKKGMSAATLQQIFGGSTLSGD